MSWRIVVLTMILAVGANTWSCISVDHDLIDHVMQTWLKQRAAADRNCPGDKGGLMRALAEHKVDYADWEIRTRYFPHVFYESERTWSFAYCKPGPDLKLYYAGLKGKQGESQLATVVLGILGLVVLGLLYAVYSIPDFFETYIYFWHKDKAPDFKRKD